MLQSVLAFVIPTVITLSAAVYFFRQAQKTEERGRRYPRYPQNGNNSGDHGGYTSSRQRRPQNTLYDSECAICFDNRPLVELYPCGHKNFCHECIDTLIFKTQRRCPYCRTHIRGYAEL